MKLSKNILLVSICFVLFLGGVATTFSGLLHFNLDTYLIMLSVKEGGIEYHFLSL